MIERITIMQGDQYYVPFTVTTVDGTPHCEDILGDVEITIGRMRKSLVNGDVEYNEQRGEFSFLLTQEETFNMSSSTYKLQIRVKSKDGHVLGETTGLISVAHSRSKEVL